ncbi:hypothetical protein [Micrococcus sp. IITD107]|uniref:glycoside hydrolase family 78 protein n=1 Tax=Micrococcus sp. IITD107 TaxID=3342790 RepID=UPI0035BA5CCB
MAISWGSPTSSSGNALRLGYELTVSPSSPTASTTSVTVTLKLYAGTRFGSYDDFNSYSVSGDFTASGSKSLNHTSSSSWSTTNVTLIGSWSKSVSLSYTTRATVRFSATMSGVEAAPGTARVSGAVTVPLRPVSAPAAPTNVTVRRAHDAQHGLYWDRNATTAAPYDRQRIDRYDSVTGGYKTIATVSGTATAFTDSSTVANRRYRYRLVAINAAGSSTLGESNASPFFFTSPTGPSETQATKRGADILVQWFRRALDVARYEVQDYADGIAQTPTVLTTANAAQWWHTSADPSKTHRYRVRAVIEDPVVGRLESAWSVYSNTVQLQAPPAAPSNLKPGSGAIDATEPVPLTWAHNAVDTTEQTAYEFQHRPQGGTWTTTGKVASPTSRHTVPADTWANGQSIEWQVRTWGDHADASPWSPLAVLGTSARPTGTILSPTGTLNGSVLIAEWAFYDSEDSQQASARVSLYDAAGALLERQTIVGPAMSYRFSTRVQDGQEYRLGIQVMDAAGVWSLEAQQAIPVAYASPPSALVDATWDLETGTISVQITHPEPDAAEVDAVSCELWRSANGDEWVQIAADLPLQTTVVDLIPATEGVNHYRVLTYSALPSTAESHSLAVPVNGRGWIFINAGPNFSEMVKVRDNAKTSFSPTRARSLHHFAGRQYPVEVAGQARTLGITAQVRLGGGSSTWDEIEQLLDGPAPFCYRDHTRRAFVGNPSFSHSFERIIREASLSFDRIDYQE